MLTRTESIASIDIAPGADYSGYEPAVQAVCDVVHTPEVIDAYLNPPPPEAP